jgi:TonB family protein
MTPVALIPFVLRLAQATPEAVAPVVVSATLPAYPEMARNAFVWGTVQVDVRIGPSGEVTNATVLRETAFLREVAIAAAKRWTFAPSRSSVDARLTFVFTLLEPDTPEADCWTRFEPPFTARIATRKVLLH